MNRKITVFLAALAITAGIQSGAQAHGSQCDYSTSSEYRTNIQSFGLTQQQQSDLDAAAHAESSDLQTAFAQEREDLLPILNSDQLATYDRCLSSANYYNYGLMTPEQYQAFRSDLDARLNLTDDQRAQFMVIERRTEGTLADINSRYESRYTAVLTPDQWSTYRTDVTRAYIVGGAAASTSSMESTAASSSSEEIVERRVYTEETTVEQAPTQTTTRMETVQTPAPAPAAKTTNWRNHDLK